MLVLSFYQTLMTSGVFILIIPLLLFEVGVTTVSNDKFEEVQTTEFLIIRNEASVIGYNKQFPTDLKKKSTRYDLTITFPNILFNKSYTDKQSYVHQQFTSKLIYTIASYFQSQNYETISISIYNIRKGSIKVDATVNVMGNGSKRLDSDITRLVRNKEEIEIQIRNQIQITPGQNSSRNQFSKKHHNETRKNDFKKSKVTLKTSGKVDKIGKISAIRRKRESAPLMQHEILSLNKQIVTSDNRMFASSSINKEKILDSTTHLSSFKPKTNKLSLLNIIPRKMSTTIPRIQTYSESDKLSIFLYSTFSRPRYTAYFYFLYLYFAKEFHNDLLNRNSPLYISTIESVKADTYHALKGYEVVGVHVMNLREGSIIAETKLHLESYKSNDINKTNIIEALEKNIKNLMIIDVTESQTTVTLETENELKNKSKNHENNKEKKRIENQLIEESMTKESISTQSPLTETTKTSAFQPSGTSVESGLTTSTSKSSSEAASKETSTEMPLTSVKQTIESESSVKITKETETSSSSERTVGSPSSTESSSTSVTKESISTQSPFVETTRSSVFRNDSYFSTLPISGVREFFISITFNFFFNPDYADLNSAASTSFSKYLFDILNPGLVSFGFHIVSGRILKLWRGSVNANIKYELKALNNTLLTYFNVLNSLNVSLQNSSLSNNFTDVTIMFGSEDKLVSAGISNWTFYVIAVCALVIIFVLIFVFIQIYGLRKKRSESYFNNIEAGFATSSDRSMSFLRNYTSEDILRDYFELDDNILRSSSTTFNNREYEA